MCGSELGVNVLSLCSGIAGLDLGIRAAFPRSRTVAYVEREAYACAVLAEKGEAGLLDQAPIFADLACFNGRPFAGLVDAVAAGFPCQDISCAGLGAGIDGARSGLWRHVHRVICEIRPSLVFLENVSALTSRGLDRVLGDLAQSGFNAEWLCLRASDVGASHRRERIFILGLADADGDAIRLLAEREVADTDSDGRTAWGTGNRAEGETRRQSYGGDFSTEELANADETGLALERRSRGDERAPRDNADRRYAFPPGPNDKEGWAKWTGPQPAIRREPDGISDWVGELAALGNAVVPQQAELAFQMLAEKALTMAGWKGAR